MFSFCSILVLAINKSWATRLKIKNLPSYLISGWLLGRCIVSKHADKWITLKTWQKVVLALLLIAMVPFMPELLIVVDFGGLEMLVGLSIMYFKSLQMLFLSQYDKFCQKLLIMKLALSENSINQPSTFAVHSLASISVLFITGSVALSCAIWLPAMVILQS